MFVWSLCALALSLYVTVPNNAVKYGEDESASKLEMTFDSFQGGGFAIIVSDVPCRAVVGTGYNSVSVSYEWTNLTTGVFSLGRSGYAKLVIHRERRGAIRYLAAYDSVCTDIHVSTNFSVQGAKSPANYGGLNCYIDGLLRNSLTFSPGQSQKVPAGVKAGVMNTTDGYDFDGKNTVTGWFGTLQGGNTQVDLVISTEEPTDDVTIGDYSTSSSTYVDGNGEKIEMTSGSCSSYTKCDGLWSEDSEDGGSGGGSSGGSGGGSCGGSGGGSGNGEAEVGEQGPE